MVDAFLGSRAYLACAGSSLFCSVSVRLFPGAGTRPGGRGTFLSRDKKVPKETRPAVCDPFAALRGKPGARRWRGALRNSLRAARCAQTAAASQFTKHARLRACHPTTASPQAQPERGWRRHGPSLRSAWHAAPACWGPSAAMARVGLQPPSGRTEERRAWGGRVCRRTHALRDLTCRVCLSAAPQARSELRDTAPRPSTAGCPFAPAKGIRTAGACFFCFLFLHEQEKGVACRGESRPRETISQKHYKKESCQRKTDKPWRQIGEHP